MSSSDEKFSEKPSRKAKKSANEKDCHAELQVHPEFQAFLECVKDDSVIEFSGFIGAKDGSSVSLYPDYNANFFYEIPIEGIRFVKRICDDCDGRVKLFVADTARVRSRSASVRTAQFRRSTAMAQPTCESVRGRAPVGRTNDGLWDVYEINGAHYARVIISGDEQQCHLFPVARHHWTPT